MMMSKLMRTPERLLRVMMTETADSESGDTPGEHQDSGTLSAIRSLAVRNEHGQEVEDKVGLEHVNTLLVDLVNLRTNVAA